MSMVVFGVQILIILICIGSAFYGLWAFIGTTLFLLAFTFSNVVTIGLLVTQTTVIIGAGAIGLCIAIITSCMKSTENFDAEEYMRREKETCKRWISSLPKFFIACLVFFPITTVAWAIYYYCDKHWSGKSGIVDIIAGVSATIGLCSMLLLAFTLSKNDSTDDSGLGCATRIILWISTFVLSIGLASKLIGT